MSRLFLRFPDYLGISSEKTSSPSHSCTLHPTIISFSLICFVDADDSRELRPFIKSTGGRRLCTCPFLVRLIYVRENGLDRRFVSRFDCDVRSFFEKRRATSQGLGYTLLPGVNSDNAQRLRREFPSLGCRAVGNVMPFCFAR